MTATDDAELAKQMEKAELENAEIAGDSADEDDGIKFNGEENDDENDGEKANGSEEEEED